MFVTGERIQATHRMLTWKKTRSGMESESEEAGDGMTNFLGGAEANHFYFRQDPRIP